MGKTDLTVEELILEWRSFLVLSMSVWCDAFEVVGGAGRRPEIDVF